MSEERREILKMLADRVITVDEAERLLKALWQGEAEGQRAAVGGEGWAHHGRFAFRGLGGALAGIGPMVRGVVEEAVSGLGLELGDDEDEGLEPVSLEGGSFSIEPGATLVLRQRRTLGSGEGARLELSASKGEACGVDARQAHGVRVLRGRSRAVVAWDGGELAVVVPAGVQRLKVLVTTATVRASDLPCELKARTMGGRLDLCGLVRTFAVRAMGGDVRLSMGRGFEGDGRVVAMGGSIELGWPREVGGTLKAVALGGDVRIDESVGRVCASGGFARQRVEVTLGEGPTRGTVALRALGGTIRVHAVEP